jgi:hypothetical protein
LLLILDKINAFALTVTTHPILTFCQVQYRAIMGKKKTKTAKKKAVRAAQKASVSFAKKLTVSSAKAHGQSSYHDSAAVVSTKPKMLHQSTTSQKKKSPPLLGKSQARRRSRWHDSSQSGQEHAQFRREHDSLVERHGIEKMKRKKLSRAFTPAPASFGMAPTVSQLLHATTRQIQELEGIGNADGNRVAPLPTPPTEPSGIRPASAVYCWRSLCASDQHEDSISNNPWAVLHDDSADDIPRAGAEQVKLPVPEPSKLFQFRPATFAAPVTMVAESDSAWDVGADDDPDL